MPKLRLVSSNGSSTIAPAHREEVPSSVQLSMDNWRLQGRWAPVPSDYSEFHANLAQAELRRIAHRYKLHIIKEALEVDPWLDGLEVLQVDIVTPSGVEQHLSWNDTLQVFTVKMRDGRQGVLFERDFK